jgi:UDP-N-acetylglucosamine 2-epimerase (non-hydrolysing)
MRVSFIFGTRPEAIKLCPLILAMRQDPFFQPHVCVTGQHRQMLDQVLNTFDFKPDVDLGLMQSNQTLSGLTTLVIEAVSNYFSQYSTDLVLVQGDTTSVLSASLAAFYQKIPVGHVEAGLRTYDKYSPFPEEMNRVLTSHLATYHFAPTNVSRDNLLKEGICDEVIFVTGNTVIDAILLAIKKLKSILPADLALPEEIEALRQSDRKIVLITGHRRENFGAGFESICKAIATLAQDFSDVAFVYPVHLNPNVQKPVHRLLSQHKNIFLINPLSYLAFVAMMDRCTLILTDSGGVQEEAPSLGKPVLVMRTSTERPEALDAGNVKLIGTDRGQIVTWVNRLLTDPNIHREMATVHNPFGDGRSSERILGILKSLANLKG